MNSLILNSSEVQADQILDAVTLQPRFENFPQELKRSDQGTICKSKKIPYDPNRPNSKVNVNGPYSWGSFNRADAAYSEDVWFSVTTVKCVVDGIPKLVVVQLLANMGTACVEYFPSGNDLRAFEFANRSISGVRGQLDDWLRAIVNLGIKK
jgi:hypothetical protein